MKYYNGLLLINIIHCEECYEWEIVIENNIKSNNEHNQYTPRDIYEIIYNNIYDNHNQQNIEVIYQNNYKSIESSLVLSIVYTFKYGVIKNDEIYIFINPKMKDKIDIIYEKLLLKINQLENEVIELRNLYCILD
jgi:hypothetical protein